MRAEGNTQARSGSRDTFSSRVPCWRHISPQRLKTSEGTLLPDYPFARAAPSSPDIYCEAVATVE